ncbi:MAG: hypothetical protein M0R80_13675 [Proteobacteria bacterium]|jgi:hypothetical protein|nr:hypothetical protein [Pseudomonadota bacterium]
MTKPAQKTIIQRLDDEAMKTPIADSRIGLCRWWEKRDEDESVYGRLNREAAGK